MAIAGNWFYLSIRIGKWPHQKFNNWAYFLMDFANVISNRLVHLTR